VTLLRSIPLFVVAAIGEIGGAWLIWEGVRERKGIMWIGAGVVALGIYGFTATLQPDAHFGRILAAYGGIFVAGSLAWGVLVDKFRPDRYDIAGAVICPPPERTVIVLDLKVQPSDDLGQIKPRQDGANSG